MRPFLTSYQRHTSNSFRAAELALTSVDFGSAAGPLAFDLQAGTGERLLYAVRLAAGQASSSAVAVCRCAALPRPPGGRAEAATAWPRTSATDRRRAPSPARCSGHR